MKRSAITITGLILMLAWGSCKNEQRKSDASGSFEAEETIISAEASGMIKQFNIEEGQLLEAGQVVGFIDSTQLYLKRKQLQSQAGAYLSRKPNVSVQLAALQEELKTAQREQQRTANLVKADAATGKQLDDANARIEVIKKEIVAKQSSLEITAEGLEKDVVPVNVQVSQVDDQLAKCTLINPVKGTVLTKYAEANEMAAVGKALYKIADLSTIILRAYITGNQLPQVKLNQQVKVLTDDGKGGYKETTGTITWINSKAEFTPKTIQTKEERANTVYAIKVKVNNDGTYKIGMYGEIKFN